MCICVCAVCVVCVCDQNMCECMRMDDIRVCVYVCVRVCVCDQNMCEGIWVVVSECVYLGVCMCM